MRNDWVYDIETYPNVFTIAFEHCYAPFKLFFEISDWKNESREIISFVSFLRDSDARLVGFNSLGFDYPVLHLLLKMGYSDANTLYQKAQSIFDSQDNSDGNRWDHLVRSADRQIEQIDLFKIHHFDNKAKATSLKVLEFNMQSDNISDLPFEPGTVLTKDCIAVLKEYNLHDVAETKKFYHHTLPMIEFREELTRKYARDFMNHNDTKIGKDYFAMKLEEAGIACYDYSDKGRTPRQTRRPVIYLKEAVFDWITFHTPQLQRIKEFFQSQSITETKGVFKDLEATVNGFTFVFGSGGIHGSVENKVIRSDDIYTIIDLDVKSFYPNLAIVNKLRPAHLGDTFPHIYKYLYEQRDHYSKTLGKKSAQSAMLKLALNGVYGDSNNPYSVFYDPLFTMSITINGQLLLCKLAEMLMTIPDLTMIQANTDGLTVKIKREYLSYLESVVKQWERLTELTMEQVEYNAMYIRDVNSYMAVPVEGDVKCIGAYDTKPDWHQDHSAMVVPKVVQKVLLEDVPIRKTLEEWSDIMDFMKRVRVPRKSHLYLTAGESGTRIQNTTRYCVTRTKNYLMKYMPPLKDKTEWRKIGIESGWGVTICNDMRTVKDLDIDYDYYAQEVEKLCLGLA